jgi:copper transport protein
VHGQSRLATVVATAGLALFCTAAPALAHAEVTATSPQSGGTVHGNVTRISVTFSEAVTLVPHALRMTTDAGIPVNLETARLTHGGTVLSANVQDHLAAGDYAVAWRAEADDGHLESSTFSFAVAGGAGTTARTHEEAAPPLTPPGSDEPLWPVLVAAGIALLGGLAAGIAVRRGLRLVRAVPLTADMHAASPSDHDTLRLPM